MHLLAARTGEVLHTLPTIDVYAVALSQDAKHLAWSDDSRSATRSMLDFRPATFSIAVWAMSSTSAGCVAPRT